MRHRLAWHNCVMRRHLLIVGIVLLAIAVSTVRISYHKLGWGAYWGVDFVVPRHR